MPGPRAQRLIQLAWRVPVPFAGVGHTQPGSSRVHDLHTSGTQWCSESSAPRRACFSLLRVSLLVIIPPPRNRWPFLLNRERRRGVGEGREFCPMELLLQFNSFLPAICQASSLASSHLPCVLFLSPWHRGGIRWQHGPKCLP